MSEIQVIQKEVETVRGTMEQMAVGNFFTRPVDQWATLRNYASMLKRFSGKEYKVKKDGEEIRVTRIA